MKIPLSDPNIVFAFTISALWTGGLVIVSYMAGFNAGIDSRRKKWSVGTVARTRSSSSKTKDPYRKTNG